MEIAEIRREKLRQYIKQHYKTRAEFADAIGKSPAQVAMWFMKSDGKRDIGEKLAREIETALGRPNGWMDRLYENDSAEIIPDAPDSVTTMDELELQILAIMKQQSPEQKEALLEIAKTLNKMS